MSNGQVEAALQGVQGHLIGDVRSAIAGINHAGVHFVAVSAQNGPFAISGLAANANIVVTQPQSSGGTRVATVPIAQLPNRPFHLSWMIFAGFAIPAMGTYLIDNGQVARLGLRKKTIPTSESWEDSTRVF